ELEPTCDQQMFVDDAALSGNYVGIRSVPSGGSVVAAIDHTRVEHNQYGIESDGSTHTTIRDSVAENQSLTGFGSFGGADVQIKDSVTAHNYYGVITDSTMRVSSTLIN